MPTLPAIENDFPPWSTQVVRAGRMAENAAVAG